MRAHNRRLLKWGNGNGYRRFGKTSEGRPKRERPVFSPGLSAALIAERNCTTVPVILTRTIPKTTLSAPTTRATPAPVKSTISERSSSTSGCWNVFKEQLTYVRLFRDDFTQEMLTQDKASRRAELTQKRTVHGSAWRSWTRSSSGSI